MSTEDRAQALLRWLRDYAREHINSRLIDERRSIPPHVMLDFGNEGLFGLQVDTGYQGLGLSQVQALRVYEQLGAIDLTLATLVSSHANGACAIERHGSSALRARWLSRLATGRAMTGIAMTERDAGSNPAAFSTTAVNAVQGGWHLNGDKYLVDSGSWASVLTVLARTRDTRTGAWSLSAFAVARDTPGVHVGAESLTTGLRGMVQTALTLDNVYVGPDSLLGELGAGASISQQVLSIARLNLAGKSIGGTKRCLQLLHRFAARRRIGTGLLWDNPVTQNRVLDLGRTLWANERLVAVIAQAIDAGRAVPQEVMLLCKVAATEMLVHATQVLAQALGGRGYEENNPVAQMLRDARSFLLSEGPSETLLMYAGASALGGDGQLQQFLSDELGSPALAGQLTACAQRLVKAADDAGAADDDWANYLIGHLASEALLAGASLDPRQYENGWVHELATHRWQHVQHQTVLQAGSVVASESMAGVIAYVSAFESSIGDVEQTLAGERTDLDPLLRKAEPGSGSATTQRAPLADMQAHWNLKRPDLAIETQHVAGAFERQVRAEPERIALHCAGQTMTYRALNERANQIACALRDAGLVPGAVVGVCSRRSIDLPAVLLAILKLDAIYMPIDASAPVRRLETLLQSSGATHLTGHAELIAKVPAEGLKVLDVESVKTAAIDFDEPNDRCAAPDQPAYLIYTSGSTGTPKGVLVGHRSVLNFLGSMIETPGIHRDDRLLAITPISFDISVLELFAPLMVGAQTIIAQSDQLADPEQLAQLIEQAEVSLLQATPASWQMLVDNGWAGGTQLRALCGGDKLSIKLADRLAPMVAELWNMYGPTETTVWSSVDRVVPDDGPVSIGRAVARTGIYLLDDAGAPAPDGTVGEIYIAGDGLALGYHGQPELTAERFVPDPFVPETRMYRTGDLGRRLADGRIEHLGRCDHQVKVRGHRIELEEIEHALLEFPGVAQAVVDAPQFGSDDNSDVRLIAFVQCDAGFDGSTDVLREHLSKILPAAMVPAQFLVLEVIPLSAHGKVDRARLRDIALATRPQANADERPLDDIEQALEQIFCEVLVIGACGRNDDFFTLGGHSLLATRLLARVRKCLGVKLPMSELFVHSSIAGLAERVRDHRSSAPAHGVGDVLPLRAADESPVMSSGQLRFWFLDRIDPGNTRYNMPWGVRLTGKLDAPRLCQSLQLLSERHEVLRSQYLMQGGKALQQIASPAPWILETVDLSDCVPADQPQRVAVQWRNLLSQIFDLQHAPLMRTRLLRFAPEHHVLLGSMHHIITDGTSNEVLYQELGALYESLGSYEQALPEPLPYQYDSYARWELARSTHADFGRGSEFWRTCLADVPPLAVPVLRSVPGQENAPVSHQVFRLDERLTRAIDEFARAQRVTRFMVLMAAWQLQLAQQFSQIDFAVGYASSNRARDEFQSLIGCFTNTLAMRSQLMHSETFAALVQRVRQAVLSAHEHSGVPFEQVVRSLSLKRRPGQNPVFQAMLDMQHVPEAVTHFGDLSVQRIDPPPSAAKLDLMLAVRPDADGLRLTLEYRENQFEPKWASQSATRFVELLAAAIEHPDRALALGAPSSNTH